jgi:hypothetical protein
MGIWDFTGGEILKNMEMAGNPRARWAWGTHHWMVYFREHHQKECGWFRDLGAVSHDFGNICVELGFYIIYTPIQVALSPDPWSRRADPDELIQTSFPSSSCHWIPRSTIPLKHPCHFVGFSMNSTIITYHNHPAIGDPWKFKDLGHHGTYAQAARQPPTRRCMASPLRSFRKATERSSRLQATNVRSGNTPWSNEMDNHLISHPKSSKIVGPLHFWDSVLSVLVETCLGSGPIAITCRRLARWLWVYQAPVFPVP